MFKKTIAVVTACALSSCSLVTSCLYTPVRASAAETTFQEIFDIYQGYILDSAVNLSQVYSLYLQLLFTGLREIGDALGENYDPSHAFSLTGKYYVYQSSEYQEGVATAFCPNLELIYEGDARSERSYTALTSTHGTYSATMWGDAVYFGSVANYNDSTFTFSSYLSVGTGQTADYAVTGTDFLSPLTRGGTINRLSFSVQFAKEISGGYNGLPVWRSGFFQPSTPTAVLSYSVGFPDSPYKLPSAQLSTPEDWDDYAKDTLMPYILEIDPDAEDYIVNPVYSSVKIDQFPYQNLPSLPTVEGFPEMFVEGATFWFTRFDELVSGFSLKPILVTILVIAALSMLIVGV